MPEGDDYKIDIIDTWEMTITHGSRRTMKPFATTGGAYPMWPRYELVLPGKPYQQYVSESDQSDELGPDIDNLSR